MLHSNSDFACVQHMESSSGWLLVFNTWRAPLVGLLVFNTWFTPLVVLSGILLLIWSLSGIVWPCEGAGSYLFLLALSPQVLKSGRCEFRPLTKVSLLGETIGCHGE